MNKNCVGLPVTVGKTTIVPLERMIAYQVNTEAGLSIFSSRVPVGIAIQSPEGRWGIDIDGKEVPLESYFREFDTLQQVMDNL